MFAKMLKEAMKDLNLNQAQVVKMIGKSKASVSQYLSEKQIPSEAMQRDIAISLGLSPDYFQQKENKSNKFKKMLPEEAAEILGIDRETVRKGLQQKAFPWGYAIKTSKNRWTYVINARRFVTIEMLEDIEDKAGAEKRNKERKSMDAIT